MNNSMMRKLQNAIKIATYIHSYYLKDSFSGVVCLHCFNADGWVTEMACKQLKGSVKEPNMFHNYETEKTTHKDSDVADYIELFGYSARHRHARCN